MILFLASCILLCVAVSGSTVRLAWDAADPFAGVTNYVLYASTNEISGTVTNATVKINASTNTTATVESLTPGRWWFTVTAVGASGVESDISNVVIVEVPKTPKAMRVVALQYSATLTNFHDVGFFRLRLP